MASAWPVRQWSARTGFALSVGRLAQTAASSTGWTKLGIVASRQMQARLAPDVEIQDADYSLSNALYLLN